jgi:hypothetical protein
LHLISAISILIVPSHLCFVLLSSLFTSGVPNKTTGTPL